MKKISLIFGIFLILIIFNFCSSSTESEDAAMQNTQWSLSSFVIDGESDTPPADQTYNIKFLEDGTFYGQSDCNDISGGYTINSENTMIIDSIFITEKACSKQSISIYYYTALSQTEAFELTGNRLSLSYEADSKLVFTAN